MLPQSRQPEIIRLHHLEDHQRIRYIGSFTNIGYQWLPQRFYPLLPLLGDLYFAFITICRCQRRLGEEYTYTAKFIQKHYEEEGLLMNKKYRTIMFVLEIVQRHVIKTLLKTLINKMETIEKLKKIKDIVAGDLETMLANGKWFMIMLFMLGWNKHYNVVDTLLGTKYIYTFKNKNQKSINYRIQGWLLFVVFLVKGVRAIMNGIITFNEKSTKVSQLQSTELESEDGQELCRICYGNMKNKSSTVCGHIFCWECILKHTSISEDCPVCRSKCLPRQIVQLQNF